MSDLRHSATEAKRDHDHKAKWARGARLDNSGRWASWDMSSATSPMRLRPALPPSSAYNESSLRSARHAVYTHFQHDVKEALSSDSSSDEAVHEALSPDGILADDPLAVYAISGNTVLSNAVSTAETKYENKVTEKLAKEYEFVSKQDDNGNGGYVADVDDFEIIEHDAV